MDFSVINLNPTTLLERLSRSRRSRGTYCCAWGRGALYSLIVNKGDLILFPKLIQLVLGLQYEFQQDQTDNILVLLNLEETLISPL